MGKGRKPNSPERNALVGRGESGKYGGHPSTRKEKAAAETGASKSDSKNSSPVFFSATEPPPPKGMTKDGAAVWREEIGPTLQLVMLQRQMYPIFEAYCEELARVRRLRSKIAKIGEVMTTPSGYARKRPEVDLYANAKSMVVKLAEQLNLTPKSWINSSGTRRDRQLDLFAAQQRAAQTPGGAVPNPETPATPAPTDEVDAYVASRPVHH